MEDIQYDVFISYSRKDYVDEAGHIIPGNAVSEIKELLKKNNISYWFDEEGVYSGETFAEKIATNIEKSLMVLFLSSYNANQSKWTSKEISAANMWKKHIIPVRLDDSAYNKTVMLYISDLDFVEYYKNKEEAKKSILDSILHAKAEYEASLRKQEQERQEAARRKKEQEQRESKQKAQKVKNICLILALCFGVLFVGSVSFHIIFRTQQNTINVDEIGVDEIGYEEKKELTPEELLRIGNEYYDDKNYIEAIKYFQKAAEKGNANAQYNLGCCYEYGKGVSVDYTEAVKWYRKAAEKEYADAQFNLGCCYENGKGVSQDYTEAVKWYRKAAEQGQADAQFNLGYCYEYGKGVSQDYTEAVKWWRKAAEKGNANAQNSLGDCYYYGGGVSKDYTEAVKWYRKAADRGHEKAKKALERLRKSK